MEILSHMCSAYSLVIGQAPKLRPRSRCLEAFKTLFKKGILSTSPDSGNCGGLGFGKLMKHTNNNGALTWRVFFFFFTWSMMLNELSLQTNSSLMNPN